MWSPSPFYRWGHWGTERWGSWPNVTSKRWILNCTSSHESLGSSFDYKVGHATNKKTHHKRAYSSHIPSCGLPEVPCSTRLHSGWLLWFFFCVWERWAFDRIQLPAPCSPACVFPEQLLGLGQQSPYSLLVPSIVTNIWEKTGLENQANL